MEIQGGRREGPKYHGTSARPRQPSEQQGCSRLSIGYDSVEGVMVRIGDAVNGASERSERAGTEDVIDTCGKDTLDEGGAVASPRGAEEGVAHVEPAYLPIGRRKGKIVEITHDDERIGGIVNSLTHALCLLHPRLVSNGVLLLEFLKVILTETIRLQVVGNQADGIESSHFLTF